MHHRAKLDKAKVREIRKRHRAGVSQHQLAKDFGVTQPTISQVVNGDTWKESEFPEDSDRETWQNLVDGAHALLAIDSARQYGLVTGGPVADQERCEKVLTRGRFLGFTPSHDCIERFIEEINGRKTGS